MAMRPRGGGGGARGGRSGVVRPIYEDLMWTTGGGRGAREGQSGVVQPVYEDFKPTSKWQQDDESHALNIYLPGFIKEQITVSTEGKKTVRVRGERLIAGNKWSRFVKDFEVPENGEINSVRAKYQGGILNITIPKKEPQQPLEAVPPPPKSDNVQKQPASQKGQDKVSSEASTSQTKDEQSLQQKTSADPRTTQGREGDGKQHVTQNDRDKDFPTYESVKTAVAQDAKEQNNEEKKLLVNMGVAMLAIVALTAYVSYKFASGKDKN